MSPHLPQELRQTLAQHAGHAGEPLQVEDSVIHAVYVIVQLDMYERMQHAVDYDATDPDLRAFYPAFAAAVKDDLDGPGMEQYDHKDASRRRP